MTRIRVTEGQEEQERIQELKKLNNKQEEFDKVNEQKMIEELNHRRNKKQDMKQIN